MPDPIPTDPRKPKPDPNQRSVSDTPKKPKKDKKVKPKS